MNNEPVAWKAYEEVHFNDQYILRWVREGDEYVNKITKEMMEDLKSVVRQQQVRIKQLEETQEYLYKTHDKDKAKLAAAEQYCLDAFERGKQIGYADGMINRKASEK